MKSYLFVLRKPAHSGSHVQEMLDTLLTVAAFDQHVSLLLLDDAVFHIKSGQHPETMAMKDTAAIFTALGLYDVNSIYVEQESLQERGLAQDALCMPVKAVGRHTLAELMAQFDVIFPG